MSDAYRYIDVESDEFEDAPRALREAYKALAKSHKDAVKERDEARSSVAQRAVADVLADKQFKNPKRVERDLLADGIDPLDKSAVDSWLASNGDDYAKGATAPQEPAAQEQQTAAPVPTEVQNGYQSLEVPGVAPAGENKLASVIAKITPDMDGAAVEKLFAEHGI